MCTRTARIARPRPSRSFGRVACAAAFMSARAAVTRYRKHRRKRTAKRADFGLASSMYSVLNRTRRVAGSCGRSESCGRKPKSDCRTLPTTSAGWRRWNGWLQLNGVVCPARPKRAPGAPSNSLLTTNYDLTSPSRRAGDQSDYNTRRAYLSDLAHFERWGGKVPATDELIASYLAVHCHQEIDGVV